MAMRTNIDIDNELIQRAMELSGLTTKKEVVNQALLDFVANRTRRDLLEIQGRIQLSDGYDYKRLREGR